MDKEVFVGFIAALITIFVFVTGKPSIQSFFKENENITHTETKKTSTQDKNLKPKIEKKNESIASPKTLITGYGKVAYGKSFSMYTGQQTSGSTGDFSVMEWSSVWHSDIKVQSPNSSIIDLGLVNFDMVKEAPELERGLFSSNYKGSTSLQVGHVYCMRINGGKQYAKILITDNQGDRKSNNITYFKYVLQQSGTRAFY